MKVGRGSSVVPKLISLSSLTVARLPSSKVGGASSTSSLVTSTSESVPSSIVIWNEDDTSLICSLGTSDWLVCTIVRLLALSDPSMMMSRVELHFMHEGILLRISSLAFSSFWTSKFIEFWEQLLMGLFVAPNQSKTDLHTRVSRFCVKQVVSNLSNTMIHEDEASMWSNTKTRDEEWSFLWFELSPISTIMYWELKALLLFLIHIWVGCFGV